MSLFYWPELNEYVTINNCESYLFATLQDLSLFGPAGRCVCKARHHHISWWSLGRAGRTFNRGLTANQNSSFEYPTTVCFCKKLKANRGILAKKEKKKENKNKKKRKRKKKKNKRHENELNLLPAKDYIYIYIYIYITTIFSRRIVLALNNLQRSICH